MATMRQFDHGEIPAHRQVNIPDCRRSVLHCWNAMTAAVRMFGSLLRSLAAMTRFSTADLQLASPRLHW
jgi:hypothetical protein